eukprot:TRINITY_DN120207_c1_g1_i1.p2 TRINITY_DN120207_c1_g1~~TRINITY_DN120207_c1_g1_i1.p2  ORF type:complete len:597 (-),score=20.89 TRINITY_DN120207_c1_g1_i1:3580-5370(-)
MEALNIYIKMRVIIAILWFVAAIEALNSEYYGIQIVRTCESILKDNLFLAENVFKELKGIDVGEFSDTHGDWWNRRALDLTHIKAVDFSHNASQFSLKNCQTLPTGHLDVVMDGQGFSWKISFDWKYSFPGVIRLAKGTGTAEIISESVELVQSYTSNVPSTNVCVKWRVASMKLNKSNKVVNDWVRTLLSDKVLPQLTMKINLKTGPISSQIIKSYNSIVTKYPEFHANINNTLHAATGATHEEKNYTVLLYNATISVPELKLKETVTEPTQSKPLTEVPFDYKVCYAMHLFEQYLDVMFRTEYYVRKISDPEEYGLPGDVRYYKALIPSLSNKYSDKEKVAIECKPNQARHVEHINYTTSLERKMLIPTQCEFYIKANKEHVLDLLVVYKTSYKIEHTGRKVYAKLGGSEIHTLETVPRLDIQGNFRAAELADTAAAVWKGIVVAAPDGFAVDTLRQDKYTLNAIEGRVEDVCLLFEDTDKFQLHSPLMIYQSIHAINYHVLYMRQCKGYNLGLPYTALPILLNFLFSSSYVFCYHSKKGHTLSDVSLLFSLSKNCASFLSNLISFSSFPTFICKLSLSAVYNSHSRLLAFKFS